MKRYSITNEVINVIKDSPYSLREISGILGFEIKNIIYRNVSINENHLEKLNRFLNFNSVLKEIRFNYIKNLGNHTYTGKFKSLKEGRKLAEFIGIMLGDGNIYKNSIRVSFDKRNKKYINYVRELCKELFGVEFKKYATRIQNSAYLYCYNQLLVLELIEFGLKRGNKIKTQVGIPNWIKDNKEYLKYCIGGLIDTDGCIYRCKREKQVYVKFTNHNKQLLNDFKGATKNLGYSFAKANDKNTCLYRKQEVVRFLNDIKPFKFISGVVV